MFVVAGANVLLFPQLDKDYNTSMLLLALANNVTRMQSTDSLDIHTSRVMALTKALEEQALESSDNDESEKPNLSRFAKFDIMTKVAAFAPFLGPEDYVASQQYLSNECKVLSLEVKPSSLTKGNGYCVIILLSERIVHCLSFFFFFCVWR
jgi:hypothetical protein